MLSRERKHAEPITKSTTTPTCRRFRRRHAIRWFDAILDWKLGVRFSLTPNPSPNGRGEQVIDCYSLTLPAPFSPREKGRG